MQKYLFLIPFFLFACKKNDDVNRISIPQQPAKIVVYAIDTATDVQTLQHETDYFYNTVTKRFDSIIIDGNVNRFNYSKLTSEYKVLLNYTDSASTHQEILFDANFYSLTSYKEIPSSGSSAVSTLQYDIYKRITGFLYTNSPATNNFSKTYTYKNDSIFVLTNRPSDACTTNDTIINTFYDMSIALPYLLFTNLNNTCSTIGLNILRAVPVSNYTNKLPFRILNETTQTDFTYTGDSKSRLVEALLVTKMKSNNVIVQKLKIVVTY